MRRFVGVSADLAPVSATLRGRGFDVRTLPESVPHDTRGLDAVVVSGEARGVLGVWRTDSPVPVVDADGKTPDEVAAEVETALRGRGQG